MNADSLLKRSRLAEPAGLLWMAALLVAALAAAVLLQAGRLSRQAPERIRVRLAEQAELARHERTVLAWTAARDAVLKSRGGRTGQPDFKAVVDRAGGLAGFEIPEPARAPLADGWEAVRIRVNAENAVLASLSPLFEAAEAADPAWRLAALSIEPLSPRPGRGRVELVFESLAGPRSPGEP